MVQVQAQRACPEPERHGAIAVVQRHAVVNATGEQSREEDETFGGGDEAERLIDVGAGDGRQVRAGDPDEHQAAKGIELNTAAGGLRLSRWHGSWIPEWR